MYRFVVAFALSCLLLGVTGQGALLRLPDCAHQDLANVLLLSDSDCCCGHGGDLEPLPICCTGSDNDTPDQALATVQTQDKSLVFLKIILIRDWLAPLPPHILRVSLNRPPPEPVPQDSWSPSNSKQVWLL